MTKPNMAFEYSRADEVAECWDGVSEELYFTLWRIVPHQRPIPNLEDNGPHDVVGWENLASHWHRLSEADQVELNRLAEERDRQYEEWRRQLCLIAKT